MVARWALVNILWSKPRSTDGHQHLDQRRQLERPWRKKSMLGWRLSWKVASIEYYRQLTYQPAGLITILYVLYY